jgi:hypothetical protein
MPKIRRPPERTSVEASSFASTTGLRWGRMMMPVQRRMVLVCAATNDNATSESMNGVSAGTGEGGTCGSGSTICSPVHRLSKPAASAARATSAATCGLAHGPKLIPNIAIFMAGRTNTKRRARKRALPRCRLLAARPIADAGLG